jgi:Putative prokaryotic signal transducing protein
MRRLAHAPNIAIAVLWVDALQQAGVAASMQRYFLGGVAGELPPDQCLPEVWIADAADEARARAVLEQLQNLPQHRWHCSCGELVEGGFEACWNCGLAMPATAA